MTDKEPNSMEHRIEKTQGLVWMALSAILAVQVHMMDSAADQVTWALVVGMATLAYAAFVINMTQTNRYALPLLRAFGKESWNYYHEAPEEAV